MKIIRNILFMFVLLFAGCFAGCSNALISQMFGGEKGQTLQITEEVKPLRKKTIIIRRMKTGLIIRREDNEDSN